MATSSSGSPNDGRAADLAIFTGLWTHSSCRLLKRVTIAKIVGERMKLEPHGVAREFCTTAVST